MVTQMPKVLIISNAIFLDLATCKANHVRCDSGECIPSSYLCDEEADCTDGSDESKNLCCKSMMLLQSNLC